MFDASRIVHVADRFALKRGGELAEVQLACETRGQRNASDTNTVLLFVGLSLSANVCASVEDPSPGWWEWKADAGKPLDADAFLVDRERIAPVLERFFADDALP